MRVTIIKHLWAPKTGISIETNICNCLGWLSPHTGIRVISIGSLMLQALALRQQTAYSSFTISDYFFLKYVIVQCCFFEILVSFCSNSKHIIGRKFRIFSQKIYSFSQRLSCFHNPVAHETVANSPYRNMRNILMIINAA